MRILLDPGVWARVLGVAAVLAVVYVAYLAAVTSPEENLDAMPVALGTEDEGAAIAGERGSKACAARSTTAPSSSPPTTPRR